MIGKRLREAAPARMQTVTIAGREVQAQRDDRPWYQIMRSEQRRLRVSLARVRFLEREVVEDRG